MIAPNILIFFQFDANVWILILIHYTLHYPSFFYVTWICPRIIAFFCQNSMFLWAERKKVFYYISGREYSCTNLSAKKGFSFFMTVIKNKKVNKMFRCVFFWYTYKVTNLWRMILDICKSFCNQKPVQGNQKKFFWCFKYSLYDLKRRISVRLKTNSWLFY